MAGFGSARQIFIRFALRGRVGGTPGELIGVASVSCFSMALSLLLGDGSRSAEAEFRRNAEQAKKNMSGIKGPGRGPDHSRIDQANAGRHATSWIRRERIVEQLSQGVSARARFGSTEHASSDAR